MWMSEENGYRIWAPSEFEFSGVEDENIDVHVLLEDEGEYVATFFSLECVQSLMRKWQRDGIFRVPVFWEASPIIVEELNEQVVIIVVEDLIRNQELQGAFEVVSR